MFLLDTNICIYAIKRRPGSVLGKIQSNYGKGIYISSLSIAELEFGVVNSRYPDKNRMALIEFLSIFDYLYYDDEDAIQYGQLKSVLRKQGNIIGPIDLLLASQALAKKLILVTNNTKEFNRVPKLSVNDWSL